MSEVSLVLNAKLRSVGGTSEARKLRKSNQTPAVVYGDNDTPLAITLDNQELMKLAALPGVMAKVLDLIVDGKTQKVMIKELGMSSFGNKFVHIDLLRVSKSTKVTVKVAVRFLGEDESDAIKIEGGQLAISQQEVEIICLPTNIPEHLEVSIQDLKMGETVFLSDVSLPEGVEPLHADQVVPLATMNKPRVMTEEEDLVEEEGATDADAETAEGEAEKASEETAEND